MATWQPKTILVDVLGILKERIQKPDFTGDVYAGLEEKLDDRSKKEEEEEKEIQEETLKTIRKMNVFSEDLTEEEKQIMEQRILAQKKKFQEFERKEFESKSKKIRAVFDFLHDKEIAKALKDNSHDENEVISLFAQHGYLHKLRKSLTLYESNDQKENMTQEQVEAYDSFMEKRKNMSKRPAHIHTVGRLALDDALKKMEQDPKEAMKDWSEARINAYKNLKSNPNVYYYRFNAPGEEQRTGPWTEEERKLFFARLKELGANGQWGIFSMTIPGRVGYQCSNFYRLLIKNKEIHDPNYVIDNGKVRYLFSTKSKDGDGNPQKAFRSHSKHQMRSGGEGNHTKNRKKGKRRRGSGSGSDESSSDDEFIADYRPKSYQTATRNSRRLQKLNEDEGSSTPQQSSREGVSGLEGDEDPDPLNPLPNFIDPITLEPVVQPAISPYGHVMGYANWVQCLGAEGSRNICPLTKQPLTKRDLVILTHDNIEFYRDKIIT